MLRIKTAFLFLLFSGILFGQDFEVSPVLMSFNADPGEIQKQQINIINHSSVPQKYTFKAGDYIQDKDGQKKNVALGTNKRSCAEWLNINPSFVELNPNQSAKVEVLMAVPKNGFSARWCMIQVQSTKEQNGFDADKTLHTGVNIVPRIIVLIKQTPRSSKNYQATISNLHEVTKAGDKERTFEATITNTGDNIIEANVTLNIANLQTTKEQKFTPVKATVYPDGIQIIKLTLPEAQAKGKYAVAAIMDYGHRQPLSGTQMMLEIK